MLFCFVFSMTGAFARCWARTSAGSASASRRFPQAISSVSLFLFLRLVALCVSLWVGGAPLAAFSLPLPLWRFFPLGGWVPLAVFSPRFPPVSWVGGGAILSVLFFLLLSLASCISFS